MSTIKSSAENLTLNADGANNDVIIQSNASTKVTVDGATGNVGIGVTNPVDAKLSIDNVAAGDSGLKIVHGIGNSWGLFINSDVTTHSAIYADADSLTTGEIAYFYSNSADTSSRKMIRINNENAAATGTTALHVKQDSTGLAADFTGTGGIRSAGGIKFGTDTAAANALDDYEEGTWTPTVTSATSYTGQYGVYTKIGNMVMVRGQLNLGSTSSDVAKIDGLPFASNTEYGIYLNKYYNLPSAVVDATMRTSGTALYFMSRTGNSTTQNTNPTLVGGNAVFQFTGTYLTG